MPGSTVSRQQGIGHAEAVEAELAELTRVNTQLRGEMAVKLVGWKEERDALEASARKAREAAAGQMEAFASVRKELASRPTVEEVRSLRQQLRVLQQLEFNAGDDDEVC